MLWLTIFVLGLFGGVISGLLGIGGGIVMAPLLLEAPRLLGLGELEMRVVAGLTMTQGLAGCLSGAIIHKKYQFVNMPLVLAMGIPIAIAALIGGAASKFTPNAVLLAIFAGLALIAAVMMLIPKNEKEEYPDAKKLAFNRPLAIVIALTIGLLGGLVGQGGSFILIPMMLYGLKIPTRIAIGSNLAIVLFSSIAGFAGKLATGQIPLFLASGLILGVLPGAQIGGFVSKRTGVKMLHYILAILIAAAAIKIWVQILSPFFP